MFTWEVGSTGARRTSGGREGPSKITTNRHSDGFAHLGGTENAYSGKGNKTPEGKVQEEGSRLRGPLVSSEHGGKETKGAWHLY